MKRITIIGLVLVFSLVGLARAVDNYNYALGKTPVGTFKNMANAVDGSLATSASSGKIAESPQFFTIDLGVSMYVGSVKIYWDPDALPENYSIRVSRDKKQWVTEFSGLNAAEGEMDPASRTVSQIISTTRYLMPTRYVQIYIPIGDQANAANVKIANIEVLAAQNLKFTLKEVKPYVVGNKSAIIMYKTSIGAAAGEVRYGTDPAKLDRVAANLESGVVSSARLSSLIGGKTYFYQVKAWDANGNIVESNVKNLKPAGTNLALKKKVSGTFTNLPPRDNLVDKSTNVLNRAVDGMTGYFKGMATSGSIRKGRQEVTIDLGQSYRIDSIVSYWRALAYPESFKIRVSNDNVNWKEISSKLDAGQGAFARSDAGDPMRVVNVATGGARARYVQVLVEKDSPYYAKHANWDFVQLMEVEVYAR